MSIRVELIIYKHYVLECNISLFSITTTRLVKEIKTEAGEVSFICRSCSCKKNVKKVDMDKRAKVRRKNWDKKTVEEKKNLVKLYPRAG
jgi:hypothetical protein